MAMHWPSSGPHNVAEYMMAGLPYATQSSAGTTPATRIEFPFVTRFITIKNTGTGDLAVGFTSGGIEGSDRFTVPPSGSVTEEWRLKDLYLLGIGGTVNFELMAGLTMIERRMFPVLTGSFNSSSNPTSFGYGPNGLG